MNGPAELFLLVNGTPRPGRQRGHGFQYLPKRPAPGLQRTVSAGWNPALAQGVPLEPCIVLPSGSSWALAVDAARPRTYAALYGRLSSTSRGPVIIEATRAKIAFKEPAVGWLKNVSDREAIWESAV